MNRDGTDDYVVVGADLGAPTAAADNGQDATAVFDVRSGAGSIQFLAEHGDARRARPNKSGKDEAQLIKVDK